MRLSNRVYRLEKIRQLQHEGKPYTVTEGFVKARIRPRGSNPASVLVTYDSRFLTTEEALAAIESHLPLSRSVYLFPDTMSLEDWTDKFSENLSTIQ